MTAVFADTSFWIALTNENDSAHQKAQSFSRPPAALKIITSTSVLTEYLNYFASWGPHFRSEASANVAALLSTQAVAVEPEITDVFASGLQLYRQRLDKVLYPMHAIGWRMAVGVYGGLKLIGRLKKSAAQAFISPT